MMTESSLPKSRLYTATGDRGTTSLVGGTRVPKTHPRLEAYGTVDELNSHIGLLRSLMSQDDPEQGTLGALQQLMFNLGGALATEPGVPYPTGIDQNAVQALQRAIDCLDAEVPTIRAFILPGGTTLAAQAQVCRTVCRRAERRMISLQDTTKEPLPEHSLVFINRLSDYLFALARALNHRAGRAETVWDKECHL